MASCEAKCLKCMKAVLVYETFILPESSDGSKALLVRKSSRGGFRFLLNTWIIAVEILK